MSIWKWFNREPVYSDLLSPYGLEFTVQYEYRHLNHQDYSFSYEWEIRNSSSSLLGFKLKEYFVVSDYDLPNDDSECIKTAANLLLTIAERIQKANDAFVAQPIDYRPIEMIPEDFLAS